jgi:hypothetical protein
MIGARNGTSAAMESAFMSPDVVAGYLLLDVILGALVGLWARAWGRSSLLWAVVTMAMTPFGFWLVAVALALRGRRQHPSQARTGR